MPGNRKPSSYLTHSIHLPVTVAHFRGCQQCFSEIEDSCRASQGSWGQMGTGVERGLPGEALGPQPISTRAAVFMCSTWFSTFSMTRSTPVAIHVLATQHPCVIGLSVGERGMARLRVCAFHFKQGLLNCPPNCCPPLCMRRQVPFPAISCCPSLQAMLLQGDLYSPGKKMGKGKVSHIQSSPVVFVRQ